MFKTERLKDLISDYIKFVLKYQSVRKHELALRILLRRVRDLVDLF